MIDLKELKRVSRIRLRHEMADPIAVADELAALKRDRERLRNMEREVARLQNDNAHMRPVFDAAVEYVGTRLSPEYDPASFEPDFDLVTSIRKLDR